MTCDPYLSSERSAYPISFKFEIKFLNKSKKGGLKSLLSTNWNDCLMEPSRQWEPLGSKQSSSTFETKTIKRRCSDSIGHSWMYLSKNLLAVLCFATQISFPFNS